MVRKPVVAGQFYPSSPAQLRDLIRGMVEEEARKEEAIGIVSPHAGYIYSGQVAAATISRIKFPETFIILGPNHTGRGKALSIMSQGTWETPLGAVEIDTELAEALKAAAPSLQEDAEAHESEHSIEVQLPFLQFWNISFKIVPIVMGFMGGAAYKALGKSIARAISESGKKVVILASSDMTHYEPQKSAKEKDSKAIEAIVNLNADELLKRVAALNISMCGYAPVVSLITAAKELGAGSAELVKYQTSGDMTGDYSAVVGYAGIIIKGSPNPIPPLVQLAKDTVETYIREGKVLEPEKLTSLMRQRAGVFVSLHKKGELRGCIGTFEPVYENIAQEVIANAISAATQDPRFSPVAPNELKDLDYKVDVLSSPELVKSVENLDPKKYGVIVEAGWRRGLLLPDLEGVESVEQQVDICRLKAGIEPNEPVRLYRFTVQRYSQK